MIHWIWLTPAFALGATIGTMATRRFRAGATLGALGAFLALIGLS